MKRALVASVLLASATLHADVLRLRSGESVEGFYQSEESGIISFVKITGEKMTIPSEEVENLEFSQSGIPICYTLKTSAERRCEALLGSVSSDGFVIAEGKSKRSVRKIPLDDMLSYQLRKVADYQKIGPYLALDKKAVLVTNTGEKLAGKVLETVPDGVIVRDAGGSNHTVQESSIASADVNMVTVPFRWFDLNNVIVGRPQMQSGRVWMGRSLMGGFVGMWTGFVYEYYLASAMTKKAKGDPTVLLFNNQSYFKEFQAHQNGQRYFAAGALAIYAFHWFDLYRHRDSVTSIDVQIAEAPLPDLSVRQRDPWSLALVWSYRY